MTNEKLAILVTANLSALSKHQQDSLAHSLSATLGLFRVVGAIAGKVGISQDELGALFADGVREANRTLTEFPSPIFQWPEDSDQTPPKHGV